MAQLADFLYSPSGGDGTPGGRRNDKSRLYQSMMDMKSMMDRKTQQSDGMMQFCSDHDRLQQDTSEFARSNKTLFWHMSSMDANRVSVSQRSQSQHNLELSISQALGTFKQQGISNTGVSDSSQSLDSSNIFQDAVDKYGRGLMGKEEYDVVVQRGRLLSRYCSQSIPLGSLSISWHPLNLSLTMVQVMRTLYGKCGGVMLQKRNLPSIGKCKEYKDDFEMYLQNLAKLPDGAVKELNSIEQFCFWVNIYNALTMYETVQQTYLRRSLLGKTVLGCTHKVGGFLQPWSLRAIEKDILHVHSSAPPSWNIFPYTGPDTDEENPASAPFPSVFEPRACFVLCQLYQGGPCSRALIPELIEVPNC
jgi:hypothetical protein